MTRTITATELKVNTSVILDDVAYKGTTILVERHGRPMIKITTIPNEADLESRLDKYFGIMPDFPKIKRLRAKRPTVKFN